MEDQAGTDLMNGGTTTVTSTGGSTTDARLSVRARISAMRENAGTGTDFVMIVPPETASTEDTAMREETVMREETAMAEEATMTEETAMAEETAMTDETAMTGMGNGKTGANIHPRQVLEATASATGSERISVPAWVLVRVTHRK